MSTIDKQCKICSANLPYGCKYFCTYVCFRKHSSATRLVHLNCKNCNKSYSVKKNDYTKNGSSFCSRLCKSSAGRVNTICSNCSKSIYIHKSRLLHAKLVYCDKKCFYEHKRVTNTGSNNPNYKNGSRNISNRMRNLSKYRKWKRLVFERDGYTCGICNQCFSIELLDVHHKVRLWKLIDDYPHEKINVQDDYFYDVSNGSTLCRYCHRTTYGKDHDVIE